MHPAARLVVAVIALSVWLGCGMDQEQATPPTAEAPASPASEEAGSDQPDRPQRVILISIDTLRADHLGTYGYERFTSPTLDMFALEGTVFEDASSAAPWTLPSHTSMMTGLFPMTHSVMTFATSLDEEIPTLASLLEEEGFKTAAAVSVKWLKRELYGVTKDFDEYLFAENTPWQKLPNSLITDTALEWIDGSRDEPLFVFLHYFDVHGDYTSQAGYEEMFVEPYEGIADGTSWQLLKSNLEPEYIEMCMENFDEKKCTFGAKKQKKVVDESLERVVFDERDARHLINLYDAGIRQMDAEISRLFAALRQRDLLDDSLIIITSDHGEEFLEQGRVDHFLAPYQEVLRVPLMMSGPGIPAGKRVAAPTSLVDLAPTVLSLVGAKIPPTMEGLDLSPLLHGGDDAPYRQRFLYGEAPGGLTYETITPGIYPIIQSVRRDGWKLIYDSKKDEYALFDLRSDPGEQVDLSESQPQISAQLIEEMRSRYADFTPDQLENSNVELSEEDLEELRALGYVP